MLSGTSSSIIREAGKSNEDSAAIRILTSHIGAADTARFINCFSVGFGDHTEERKQIFDNYSLDDIVREIKEYKKRGRKKNT